MDPIIAKARELVAAYPALLKSRSTGQILASSLSGAPVFSKQLLAALLENRDLAREEMQELILGLDLLAAGLPDQETFEFDPELQKVAGKLRERFSRTYKSSAYAMARAE